MKKYKSFGCHRINTFNLNFPNGNGISTVWGGGTYTEKYPDDIDWRGEEPATYKNNVEIMIDCPEKLKKRISKYLKSDENPIGWISLDQWIKVVNMLSK